ncbi:hypothetical protein P692DRAFT_20886631 [Suillus brevipes Sb2]|nr:hypothetical protein P692DRAFT_20886631 [Suillus brevipes Sb2]
MIFYSCYRISFHWLFPRRMFHLPPLLHLQTTVSSNESNCLPLLTSVSSQRIVSLPVSLYLRCADARRIISPFSHPHFALSPFSYSRSPRLFPDRIAHPATAAFTYPIEIVFYIACLLFFLCTYQ